MTIQEFVKDSSKLALVHFLLFCRAFDQRSPCHLLTWPANNPHVTARGSPALGSHSSQPSRSASSEPCALQRKKATGCRVLAPFIATSSASQALFFYPPQTPCSRALAMASYTSGSDSDTYGYDLTHSDEEDLAALIDNLAAATPRPAPTPAPRTTLVAHARSAPSILPAPSRPSKRRAPSIQSLDSELKHANAVHEAIEDLSDGDLDFDEAELHSTFSFRGPVGRPTFPPPAGGRDFNNGQATSYAHSTPRQSLPPLQNQQRPIVPNIPAGSAISYPDRKFFPPSLPFLLYPN